MSWSIHDIPSLNPAGQSFFDAFASYTASDAAQTLAVGWAPQFRRWQRRFPSEPQSSTAAVAYGMCISPTPGQHAGLWERRGGGVAVAALRPRAWVVCASGCLRRAGNLVRWFLVGAGA